MSPRDDEHAEEKTLGTQGVTAVDTAGQAVPASTAPHVVRYVSAIGRNPGEELGRSHLYAELSDGDYMPMCRYGWNRSDGAAFSIFRGHMGARGLCAICDRRRDQGLPPVDAKPGSHKTRWI